MKDPLCQEKKEEVKESKNHEEAEPFELNRVEKAVFPRQSLSCRDQPCGPLIKRVWKNINKEKMQCF
jgi:hypothetical protein